MQIGSLIGEISTVQNLVGELNNAIIELTPELEDLTVTPDIVEQNFKSNMYGYNNVKVEAIQGEDITIKPTMEEQKYNGVYRNVTVEPIESEEISITPSANEQTKEGLFDKVTVTGDNELVPENIKLGVEIFGVMGELEAEKSSGAKIFDTVENMQEDTTSQEGDLAIVYGEKISNITAQSEFDVCTFPQTVVLPSAFTDNIYTMFGSIDDSVMFDGSVMLNATEFRFDGYGENDMISISYSSEDGITYTRTDGGEENIDFGTVIKCYNAEEFEPALGYFMIVIGDYFGGLYEYRQVTDKTKFQYRNLNAFIYNADNTVTYNDEEVLDGVYDFATISEIRSAAWKAGNKSVVTYLGNDNKVYLLGTDGSNSSLFRHVFKNGELAYIGDVASTSNVINNFYIYEVDLENKTYSVYKTIKATKITTKCKQNGSNRSIDVTCIPVTELNTKSLPVALNQGSAQINSQISDIDNYVYFTNVGNESENKIDVQIPYKSFEYCLIAGV